MTNDSSLMVLTVEEARSVLKALTEAVPMTGKEISHRRAMNLLTERLKVPDRLSGR